MTRKLFILSLFALVLAGCSTTQPLCIDDAYHWQDKTPTTQTTPKTQSSGGSTTVIMQTTQTTLYVQTSDGSQKVDTIVSSPVSPETPAPSSPTLEYVNVQDTTVTVRINR